MDRRPIELFRGPIPDRALTGLLVSIQPEVGLSMFRFNSVTKSYNGKLALADITLAIGPGETTVLIGPSGCGKSTIFGLMTGLFKPDSGTVLFEDATLATENIRSIRRRLGYVIRDGGLFPHLTGHENICLMAQYLKWPAAKINQRVADLITLTRLSPEMLKRYPLEMSGGQRQRVSLMQAALYSIGCSFAVTNRSAALDPMARAEVQDELAAIFRQLERLLYLSPTI